MPRRKHVLGWTAAALTLLVAKPLMAAEAMGLFQTFFAPIPPDADALDWFGVVQVWIIIVLSIVTVALIIKYWMAGRRIALLPEDTRIQLEQMLGDKRYREAIEFAAADPSFLGKLVSSALGQASNGFPAMEKAIAETGDAETTKIMRPLELLSVLGNVGPMLGLFGTVYGIIVTFTRLVEAGGKPDPGELAGGISTALVTTFWGLVVAMPAMSAYALLRNSIDEITVDGMNIAADLIDTLRPGGGKKKAAPAPAATQA